VVAKTAAVGKELQVQLLAWEEELIQREEALAVREEKVKISERALVKVSVDLDVEMAKAKATRKEYLNRMEAHTTMPSIPSASTRCWGRRRLSSTGESRTWACVRWCWWRRSPEDSTPRTIVKSWWSSSSSGVSGRMLRWSVSPRSGD
jgi:hypothetical protein